VNPEPGRGVEGGSSPLTGSDGPRPTRPDDGGATSAHTDSGAARPDDEGAAPEDSTEPTDIHEESDAEARVKGAVPEGESEPDAGTRPEKLTGPEPKVDSSDTEAGERTAETSQTEVAVAEPTAEVLETRKGMFGVRGTGDTSGYGGLTRAVELPPAATPPFGGWWDQVYGRIGELVPNYSDVITRVVIHRGEITFHVAREHLTELVRHLRDDAHLRFEFCSGVSGVHYPAESGRELHAVYHLQSMTHNRRIRLEVSAPDADPHIPSVVRTYPTADWHERETYDMFGIIFDGHPALTRILMPDDWPGHPQRKDYPLGGIPVEYKGATIAPPDQRRSYS
jgi:NADH-quinone oxidoreductase subunit C